MKKFCLFFIGLLFMPCFVFAEDNLSNYIVMDMDSGRVLKSLAKDQQILPASTTKIMTLIVALENSNTTDVVKIGDEILIADGTNIYTEIGENILFEDLLYGMILRSGNDASLSVAKHAGGTVDNFVKLMNEKARNLHLKNTSFQNPTGLDDTTSNITSVQDLATIYAYGFKSKDFRNIVKTTSYKTSSDKKSYFFKNRNEILKMYDKATGGKTGYTPKAGRLLVSSASDKGLNIVIVSHGNTYGYNNHINMYKDIFLNYENYLILNKKSFKEKTDLNGKLYINNSFSYPLAKDETSKIEKKIIYNGKKKGHVADLIVYLGDDEIHKEEIFLKEKKESFFKRLFKFA